MTESESVALPFGDIPICSTDGIITHSFRFCKSNYYIKLLKQSVSSFLMIEFTDCFYVFDIIFRNDTNKKGLIYNEKKDSGVY